MLVGRCGTAKTIGKRQCLKDRHCKRLNSYAERYPDGWRRRLVRSARSHDAVDVVCPSHRCKRRPVVAAYESKGRPVPSCQAVTPTLWRAGLSESVVIVVVIVEVVVIGQRIVIIVRVVVKIVVVPIVVIAIVIKRVIARGVRARHLEMDDDFAGLLM